MADGKSELFDEFKESFLSFDADLLQYFKINFSLIQNQYLLEIP